MGVSPHDHITRRYLNYESTQNTGEQLTMGAVGDPRMKHLLIASLLAIALAASPAQAQAYIHLDPQYQLGNPYCLAGSAAMVLSYCFPRGNDNGPFTIGRVVDDYATFFDPGWQRGTPLDPGKLYAGIKAYGVLVKSGARWDWNWVQQSVDSGKPVIVYLYQNSAHTATDAFVLQDVGPEWTYATSSYYGAVRWSTNYFRQNWDGWSTLISPVGTT